MTYIRQLLMIIFVTAVFLALQYQYWFGTNGHSELAQLKKQVAEQAYINSEQQKANQILTADIKDLKNGLEAVEEHARVDLGFIKQGETFVQMSTASTVYSSDVVNHPDSTVDSASSSSTSSSIIASQTTP